MSALVHSERTCDTPVASKGTVVVVVVVVVGGGGGGVNPIVLVTVLFLHVVVDSCACACCSQLWPSVGSQAAMPAARDDAMYVRT